VVLLTAFTDAGVPLTRGQRQHLEIMSDGSWHLDPIQAFLMKQGEPHLTPQERVDRKIAIHHARIREMAPIAPQFGGAVSPQVGETTTTTGGCPSGARFRSASGSRTRSLSLLGTRRSDRRGCTAPSAPAWRWASGGRQPSASQEPDLLSRRRRLRVRNALCWHCASAADEHGAPARARNPSTLRTAC
jgi:hypothetical protein